MSEILPQFPCLKCARMLRKSGGMEVSLGRIVNIYPVYRCDSCRALIEVTGEKFEIPFTFILKEGKPFNRSNPDVPLDVEKLKIAMHH